MKKTNLLMKTLLLCLCMVGSVSAWAADVYEYTNTPALNTGNFFTVAKEGGSISTYTVSIPVGLANGNTSNVTKAVKMEGKTSISFTTTKKSYVYVGFFARYAKNESEAQDQFKIDDTVIDTEYETANSYGIVEIANVAAGDHVLKQNGKEVEIYYVKVIEMDSDKPTVTTQPVSARYAINATEVTALSVGAVASKGTLTYQWKKYTTTKSAAVAISGATSATYTPSVNETGTTYYYCTITDDNGGVDSNVASVYVIPATGVSTWDFQNIQSADFSEYTSFWNTASSSNGYSYYGQKTAIKKTDDPVTIPNTTGNDLCNGLRVGTTGSDIGSGKLQIWIGLGIRSDRDATYYTFPATVGKGYRLTYGAASGSSAVGFTTVDETASVVTGSIQSTISTAYTESATAVIKANATTVKIALDGDNKARTIFKKLEEVDLFDGAWKASGVAVTENTFYQGDAAPTIPVFTITSSGTPAASDYSVAYSLKEGSTAGIFTFDEDGISAISNSTVGTATIIATLTSNNADFIAPTANTFEYTVTVNAKVAAMVLDPTSVTLKSTPVKRNADEAVTATVNLSGDFLEDGTYDVSVSTTGLSITPTSFTVTDGSVNQDFTLTYAPGDVAVAENNEVITFSDGTTSADLTVTYSSVVAHEWATVSTATTWDWAQLSTITIQLTTETTPTKSEEFLMGDMDGEVLAKNIYKSADHSVFNANALKIIAEYVARVQNSKNLMQGNSVKFKTSVPGTVKVTFSNTGGSNDRPYRHVKVNNTISTAKSANGTLIDTEEIPVSSGEVTIIGWIPDAASPAPRDGDNEGATMLRISKIVFTAAPASVAGTISASNWNTFSSNYPLDLSTISGGTAYVAKSAADGKVVMTECTNKVAAGTGLMIKGTADAEFSINTTADATTAPDANLLVGLPNGGEAPVGSYVFGWPTSDATDYGFYYVNKSAATLDAGKAYLDAEGSVGARLSFIFDDEETTGITDNKRDTITNNGEYFNLAGQKVAQPQKGLYIVNGRKVVVR